MDVSDGENRSGGYPVNPRTGVIMVVLGVVIGMVGLYVHGAASDIVRPEDVMWGLGRFFSDIDRSDIKLMQTAGLFGVAIGGMLLLGGLALMIRRGR